VRHYTTKIGVALSHREKIFATIFHVNGATISGDEASLENKLAEIMQHVRMSNLDEELQITNNLHILWTEKWLGQNAWNNNNSESINHVLTSAQQ